MSAPSGTPSGKGRGWGEGGTEEGGRGRGLPVAVASVTQARKVKVQAYGPVVVREAQPGPGRPSLTTTYTLIPQ